VNGASLVIHEGAAGGDHLINGQLILGREHGSADLVIDDPGVSRRHARVVTDAGTVIVEDLGSSNGTFVNGRRISAPVELAAGDELQIGATVLGLAGEPIEPTRQRAEIEGRTRPSGGPVPKRLAPHPTEAGNVPALCALFLGPLSILLIFLGAGGFFIALPCGIAAIVLGSVGIRNADRKQAGHRALARIGRFTGILGTALSIAAVIVFIVVATALDATENSVSGLIDAIRDEIEGVEIPDVDSPDVNSPDVNPPDVDAPSSGGGESGEGGGTPAPSQ
jgi:hypothetical protein